METVTETRPEMEKLHTGDTIRTFKGHYVDILNPEPDSIDIEDIAHALSQVCRFAGHTAKFYSVAQHSTKCVEKMEEYYGTEVSADILMTVLLHDASEAYVGDLARPIKRRIPQYKQAENVIMAAIAEKFRLFFPFPPPVKVVDNLMLEVEHENCMLRKNYFECLDCLQAERHFLEVFRRLEAARRLPR